MEESIKIGITVVDALNKYVEKNGVGDSINSLGIMNGRVVKLTEYNKEDCKTLLGELQKIRQDSIADLNTTISVFFRSIYLYGESRISPQKLYLENSQTTEKTEVDARQIQKRLEFLKEKYKEQFLNINTLTNTCLDEDDANTVTTETEFLSKPELHFCNSFYPAIWVFYDNRKDPVGSKEIYMSNAVVYQFEQVFKTKEGGLKLPKTIRRARINNVETIELLERYKDNYDSELFLRNFLNTTVNGKSTVRVVKDFGMSIVGHTVNCYYKVNKDCLNLREEFDVDIHVSPDSNIYREMD